LNTIQKQQNAFKVIEQNAQSLDQAGQQLEVQMQQLDLQEQAIPGNMRNNQNPVWLKLQQDKGKIKQDQAYLQSQSKALPKEPLFFQLGRAVEKEKITFPKWDLKT